MSTKKHNTAFIFNRLSSTCCRWFINLAVSSISEISPFLFFVCHDFAVCVRVRWEINMPAVARRMRHVTHIYTHTKRSQIFRSARTRFFPARTAPGRNARSAGSPAVTGDETDWRGRSKCHNRGRRVIRFINALEPGRSTPTTPVRLPPALSSALPFAFPPARPFDRPLGRTIRGPTLDGRRSTIFVQRRHLLPTCVSRAYHHVSLPCFTNPFCPFVRP